MKRRYSIVLVLGLAFFSCGPDARHDNPLDPVNGRGVSGTIYKARSGGIVAGAVVAARPVNINTVSDAQGSYNLELPGGQRYVLTVSHPQYNDTTDTIEVPEDGKLEANFFLAGRPSISWARVKTEVIEHEDGSRDHILHPECLVEHPEGSDFLKDISLLAGINDKYFAPGGQSFDAFSAVFTWNLDWDMVFGTIAFEETLVAGKTLTFEVSPVGLFPSRQTQVPGFMPLADSLRPDHGEVFTLPGYLRWSRPSAELSDIDVEIWQGSQRAWQIRVTNIDSVLCGLQLDPGGYLWRVCITDSAGNRSVAEATFNSP
jgi:hypothetical protein